MASKSSFVVIVPCYNEEHAIPAFLNEVDAVHKEFQDKCPEFQFKVIFVNNNSSDNSPGKLADFAKDRNVGEPWVTLTDCPVQGYGATLKRGFTAVQADWYGFADLDNTYPLHRFINMLILAEKENLDIVFGNRLTAKNGMPLVRRIGNLFYSIVSKLIFQNSVKDMCTGMRLFRNSKKATIINLPSNDLKFSIEFTATVLKQKWSYDQIPIDYRERIGASKLSVIKDGILFLYILLKVKFSS